MKEIWKNIKGFEGFYMISNKGRVKSLSREMIRCNGYPQSFQERLLKIQKGTNGYLYITICNKSRCHLWIARLVAQAFISNPQSKPQVNHKDGNKLNNHVDNLEWVTCSENIKHSFKIGVHKPPDNRGSKNGRAKLTDKQVLQIRGLKGKLTTNDLIKKFKVSRTTINYILNNKSWYNLL